MKTKLITLLLALTCGTSWNLTAQKEKIFVEGENGQFLREGNEITYSWTHTNNQQFTFTLIFYRGWSYMQNAYKGLNHNHGDFKRFIQQDPFKQDLKVVAKMIRNLATESGVGEVSLALSFVQSLPYQDNMGGYQRYASETLIDTRGDCSDTAVLFAGILAAWNYDCIFLGYPGHLAVGVWATGAQGTYYHHRNRDFFYCETTGSGFKIGQIPEGYDQAEIGEVCY